MIDVNLDGGLDEANGLFPIPDNLAVVAHVPNNSEFLDGPLQETMDELKRQAGATHNTALQEVVNHLKQVRPASLGKCVKPALKK
jgi:hypothetical protein